MEMRKYLCQEVFIFFTRNYSEAGQAVKSDHSG
jgi:hypothetical protein